jgi:hypothetical protein
MHIYVSTELVLGELMPVKGKKRKKQEGVFWSARRRPGSIRQLIYCPKISAPAKLFSLCRNERDKPLSWIQSGLYSLYYIDQMVHVDLASSRLHFLDCLYAHPIRRFQNASVGTDVKKGDLTYPSPIWRLRRFHGEIETYHEL